MSQTATAGDGVGIRLKVNTDLFNVANSQLVYEEEDVDDGDAKTTTMSFFGGAPRFEATYIITPNIEAGLVLGYADMKMEAAGDFMGQATARNVGLSFAYNMKLSDGLRGYVQPLLISSKMTTKDEDGESLGHMTSLAYGADLGLRIKLVKGATFDPCFEYLAGNSKMFDEDGENVDEDMLVKNGSFGLKAGISVKF
jgi:hypothetical protein